MSSDQNGLCHPPHPRTKRKRAPPACLVRATTREDGEIQPLPLKSHRTHTPPPQAPLLLRAGASGPEMELPGTARDGTAAGASRAAEGIRGWRRSSQSTSRGGDFEYGTVTSTIGQGLFRMLHWRSVVFGSAADKPRYSI
jgi:hypothetical protein